MAYSNQYHRSDIMKRYICNLVLISALFKLVCCHVDQSSRTNEIPRPAREPADLGLMHPYQEMIPVHCWTAPKHIKLYKCCPIPRLYPEEFLDSCDIKQLEEDEKSPRQEGPVKYDCKDGMCLMKKTNIVNEDNRIDYEKLRAYLDQWAANNTDFTEAILEAKKHCVNRDGLGDGTICEPDKIFVCLNAMIIWNCKFIDEPECKELQEHMDECRPYYEKPKDHDERIAKKGDRYNLYKKI